MWFSCSSLPELLEKKRLIDLHTNVATAVLDHIKVLSGSLVCRRWCEAAVVKRLTGLSLQSRKLDVYFEYEEKLLSKSTLDKSLLDIITDPDGTHTCTRMHMRVDSHAWTHTCMWMHMHKNAHKHTNVIFKLTKFNGFWTKRVYLPEEQIKMLHLRVCFYLILF